MASSPAVTTGRNACVPSSKLIRAVDLLKGLEQAADDGATGEEMRVVLNSLTLVEVKQLCKKLNVMMGKANETSLVQSLISYRDMGLFEKRRIDNDQVAKQVSYLSD